MTVGEQAALWREHDPSIADLRQDMQTQYGLVAATTLVRQMGRTGL
jgi:hypothetical protein